jgi:hypothetical protein
VMSPRLLGALCRGLRGHALHHPCSFLFSAVYPCATAQVFAVLRTVDHPSCALRQGTEVHSPPSHFPLD